jgi:hypothetical protein
MSPSESDLRAALRDGEGDDLNVDRIIAGGRALRARRRARMMTAAAVTVLVAGLGTGGAVLLSGNGNSESGSKANGGTSFDQRRAQSGTAGSLNGAAGGGAAASAANPPKAAAPNDSVTAVPCPASLPDYRLPGGGSPGQFGADGPLFSRTVDSIVVCAYGTPSAAATARPHRLVLTDGAATAVADSLEKAPRTKPTGACPFLRTADAQAIAIVGVAADGKVVGTVTTTVGDPACSVRVTNGTALRYQWLPPEVLRTALAELNRGRSHGPVLKGSPISS